MFTSKTQRKCFVASASAVCFGHWDNAAASCAKRRLCVKLVKANVAAAGIEATARPAGQRRTSDVAVF